jgi:phage protein D
MSDNFREVYAFARTKGEAEVAAKTAAKRIEREKASLELTMPGRIEIIAGMHLNLAGFRAGISGGWKVVTVRHTVSRSGWLSNIEAEAAS